MANSHHEQLRLKVELLKERGEARVKAIKARDEASARLNTASHELALAEKSLAAAILSKCKGKKMMLDGLVYTVLPNVDGSHRLEIEKFGGELL